MIEVERVAAGTNRANVLHDILLERGRQERKHGRQDHSPADFLAILAEEFGEVAKEVVELSSSRGDQARLRAELVQVAAVAVQWLEKFDPPRVMTHQTKEH